MGGAKDFFGTTGGLITAIIVVCFIIVCLGTLWASSGRPIKQNGGGKKLKHRKRFAKKKRSN